ncbi:hypothetical protein JCM11641_000806 [Rhodosporidiobolus odoratus]
MDNARSFHTRARTSPHLRFVHPALLVDWFVVFGLSTLAHYIERQPVYQRDPAHYLPPVQAVPDPAISWPHQSVERVSAYEGELLDQLTWYLPLAVFFVVGGLLRRSLHDVHHAALGLYASREGMRLIVEFIKNRVGRLRPDFLSRCAWDVVAHACTGPAGLVKDGRRSFPSGHSSTAWQGLFFLSLYLAGKNGAFASFRPALPPSFGLSPSSRTSRVPAIARSLFSSHIFRLGIALGPVAIAIWVPITRLEDHYHHVEDILAGSFIGALSALLGYCMYYPAPWKARSGAVEESEPRTVYREAEEAYGMANGGVRLVEEEEEVGGGAQV